MAGGRPREVKMIEILEKLVESLRNELQQFGEMLALLDHEQEMIRLRGANDVLNSLSAITAQSGAISQARQERHTLQQRLAWSLQQPERSTFAELLPALPEHYRLLISALVQENNELLQRVSQRAQEIQGMLHRSMELIQQFISSLSLEEQPLINEAEDSGTSQTFYEAIQ
jgi:hemerythrin superfamily protein